MKTKIYFCRQFCYAIVFLTLTGCATMKVKETHYYAVEDQTNTNVYRLTIEAESSLGKAKYQSGFFPSNAVDRVFGDIKPDGSTAELQARETIAKEIRNATVKTTQHFLKIASDANSTDVEIQKALNARRNILAYPDTTIGLPANSRMIDYDPSRGLVSRNADSKMVFVFSSNPDEVIGNIKNFAEADQTALSISRLVQVTSQQARNDVAEAEATLSVMEKGIKLQIQQVIDNVSAEENVSIMELEEQLSILHTYLKGVHP